MRVGRSVVRWLDIAVWLLVAAMLVASLAVWPLAPERVPIHWLLTGQPDRYAGKLEGLFLLPAFTLLLALGLQYLPRIDPRRSSYAEFAFAYALTRLGVVALLATVHLIALAVALGATINVTLVVAPLVGVLLIVIGAVLGQVRPNWFFGIRTPWTLSSDRSWTATHRAGRWVLIAMGLAIALAGVVQAQWSLYLAIAMCLFGVVGLIAYSFIEWRDDPDRRTAA
jgi:uncharacterized membrane protein